VDVACVIVPTPVGPVPVWPGKGVQLVGWFPAVAGGRQICQFTVVVVEPDPTALNCCVPRSTTVAVVGDIVTPTLAALLPHPATPAANKTATPSLANLIAHPPSVCRQLKFRFPESFASQAFLDQHEV
jgi:hypothetical protein